MIFKGKEKYKNFRPGSQPIIKEDDEFFLKTNDSAKRVSNNPKRTGDDE